MSKTERKGLFNVFYSKYFKRTLRYAAKLLNGEKTPAEDLAQEAFLRAYANIDRLEKEPDFIRWVYVVVRNLSFNYNRHKRNTRSESLNRRLRIGENEEELQNMIPDRNSPCPAAAAEKRELTEILNGAISALSLNYRTAIDLCCLKSLSYKTAAVVLDTNESIVAHNLMRARRELARAIN